MRSTFPFRLMIAGLGIAVCSLAIAAQGNPPAPVATPTAAASQDASTEKAQRRPPTRRPVLPPARVTVVPNPLAPQVVTIVHRLTGVKLLRLLQRQAGEMFTIENIDPFTLMADAHASILAGWVLEDGKTIAARLPQAFAELEVPAPFERGARRQPATPKTEIASPFMIGQSRRI